MEQLLILVYAITGYVSIFVFALLVGILIGIVTFAVGLNICAKIAGFKKYRSIIKKKRKKHYKIVLLGKTKLCTIEV